MRIKAKWELVLYPAQVLLRLHASPPVYLDDAQQNRRSVLCSNLDTGLYTGVMNILVKCTNVEDRDNLEN